MGDAMDDHDPFQTQIDVGEGIEQPKPDLGEPEEVNFEPEPAEDPFDDPEPAQAPEPGDAPAEPPQPDAWDNTAVPLDDPEPAQAPEPAKASPEPPPAQPGFNMFAGEDNSPVAPAISEVREEEPDVPPLADEAEDVPEPVAPQLPGGSVTGDDALEVASRVGQAEFLEEFDAVELGRPEAKEPEDKAPQPNNPEAAPEPDQQPMQGGDALQDILEAVKENKDPLDKLVTLGDRILQRLENIDLGMGQ